MSLTSQGLTDEEKATYARMQDKCPNMVNELRNQVLQQHIAANPSLATDIAAAIRTKILKNPKLIKDTE